MRFQRIFISLLAVGLLLISSLIQQKTAQFRESKDAVPTPGEGYGPSFNWIKKFSEINALRDASDPRSGKSLNMESVSMVVVLGIAGGFRSVAADVLWLKSDEWWHKGQADRMIPLLRLVTWLDPNFIDGWKIAGWHWAYNLRVQAPTPDKKDQCLQNGLRFLGEGIAWNPDRHELYFELGWTYFDKVGDMRSSASWFERALPISLVAGLKHDPEDSLKKHRWTELEEAGRLAKSPKNEDLAALYEMDKRQYKEAFDYIRPHSQWTGAPTPELILRMIGHSLERMPDIKQAVRYYEVVLSMSPQERTQLQNFMALAERADMDPDAFQQACERFANLKPGDAQRASQLRTPFVEEGARLFSVIPKLRIRDHTAPGAIITLVGRYGESYDLMKDGHFREARQALLKTHERYYRFAKRNRSASDHGAHDAFIALIQGDIVRARQIVDRTVEAGKDPASAKDVEPLKRAKEAFDRNDLADAENILEAATLKETIFSHMLARIYESEAEALNRDHKDSGARAKLSQAFQVWVSASANNASDHVAAHRVQALADSLGLQGRFAIPETSSTYDPRNPGSGPKD